MDEAQRLLVCQACEQLVLETVACTDANQAESLAALFADDAVLVRPGGAALQGRAAILQAYAARPPDRITRHLVSNIRFHSVTAEQARATSYVQVWSGSMADEASALGQPARQPPSVGEFDDSFRRFDGRWMIARREARFILQAAF